MIYHSNMFSILFHKKDNKKLAENPELEKEAQDLLLKWEEGDKTLKPSAKLVGKVYEALK